MSPSGQTRHIESAATSAITSTPDISLSQTSRAAYHGCTTAVCSTASFGCRDPGHRGGTCRTFSAVHHLLQSLRPVAAGGRLGQDYECAGWCARRGRADDRHFHRPRASAWQIKMERAVRCPGTKLGLYRFGRRPARCRLPNSDCWSNTRWYPPPRASVENAFHLFARFREIKAVLT